MPDPVCAYSYEPLSIAPRGNTRLHLQVSGSCFLCPCMHGTPWLPRAEGGESPIDQDSFQRNVASGLGPLH